MQEKPKYFYLTNLLYKKKIIIMLFFKQKQKPLKAWLLLQYMLFLSNNFSLPKHPIIIHSNIHISHTKSDLKTTYAFDRL